MRPRDDRASAKPTQRDGTWAPRFGRRKRSPQQSSPPQRNIWTFADAPGPVPAIRPREGPTPGRERGPQQRCWMKRASESGARVRRREPRSRAHFAEPGRPRSLENWLKARSRGEKRNQRAQQASRVRERAVERGHLVPGRDRSHMQGRNPHGAGADRINQMRPRRRGPVGEALVELLEASGRLSNTYESMRGVLAMREISSCAMSTASLVKLSVRASREEARIGITGARAAPSATGGYRPGRDRGRWRPRSRRTRARGPPHATGANTPSVSTRARIGTAPNRPDHRANEDPPAARGAVARWLRCPTRRAGIAGGEIGAAGRRSGTISRNTSDHRKSTA